MLNFIDFRFFLLSLSIGLLYIYLTEDYKKIIILYPTPDNVEKYKYVDKANNCFTYDLAEKECPSNTDEFVRINVEY